MVDVSKLSISHHKQIHQSDLELMAGWKKNRLMHRFINNQARLMPVNRSGHEDRNIWLLITGWCDENCRGFYRLVLKEHRIMFQYREDLVAFKLALQGELIKNERID